MFQRLLAWIRRAVSVILPNKKVEDSLGVDIAISDIMASAIDRWTLMYEDNLVHDDTKTLNLASSIASEMARLVTIEMESEITGEDGKETDRSKYLNEQYQRVVDKLRIQTEYAAAKGGMIFKPYLDNDKIAVDYVQADNFYPVRFNSAGDLVAVVFPEIKEEGNYTYTRLEYHDMLEDYTEDGRSIYYTRNEAYVKREGTEGLGTKCKLTDVKEWEHLEEELNLYDLEVPLFAYFKMPLANNKDTRSHLGVSVYAKAENLIEEADKQFSKILWEYEATEMAIDVPEDMLSINSKIPAGKERLFRKLDIDDGSFYKVFSPTIRDDSLFNGLNKILRKIEFACGLAYGTLSDIEESAKTATEIKASKQRSYATVVDIQKALRIALEHLIYSMGYLTDFYRLAPKGEVHASFTFDDSIVVDSETERMLMLQEVGANLIKPEKYLMFRYGVSEEEALEMLPDADVDMYDNLE